MVDSHPRSLQVPRYVFFRDVQTKYLRGSVAFATRATPNITVDEDHHHRNKYKNYIGGIICLGYRIGKTE